MENITLFRMSVLSTLSLFIAALITPLATVSVDLSRSAGGAQVLEWVCVWCQFGSTNNNPDGTATILNFTAFDFFWLWIPILLLIFMTFIPLLKSYPHLELSQRISDKLAINLLWVLAGLSLGIRGLLSYLITVKEGYYQELFPENMVIGELGWGAASLVIATISASSAAMFGFIEFQYDLENDSDQQVAVQS